MYGTSSGRRPIFIGTSIEMQKQRKGSAEPVTRGRLRTSCHLQERTVGFVVTAILAMLRSPTCAADVPPNGIRICRGRRRSGGSRKKKGVSAKGSVPARDVRSLSGGTRLEPRLRLRNQSRTGSPIPLLMVGAPGGVRVTTGRPNGGKPTVALRPES